ncbi:ADP-ribosyltransferase [Clostridium beijerinckii]|uniref:ADP-ribosyltransferase n=1 Tax=Clostridium beijerinckii TaxID=1520 RepID=UPI001F21D150|nr:ADP-ribosyltransferase [Clostridium beijerinckii]
MIDKISNYMKYGKINDSIIRSDYIDFKDEDVAEKWGEKHYYKWAQYYKDSMKVAQKKIRTSLVTASVECYCGYSYREINEYLRYDNSSEDEEEKDSLYYLYREMSDILAITLSMAPRVPNNVIVYRLVCDEFIKELIKNNKEGIPTLEKGFISTSLTAKIVESEEFYSDHNNMLKIYVKANTVGIYVNGVAKRHEKELLLHPNGYFKLLKLPYEENNKMIYECELIYF